MKIPVDKVSPSEARKQNTLLLDVRTPAEFEEAHIEGSVLHPLSELDAGEVARLAAGKDQCILICRSGNPRAPGCGETQDERTRLALHPRWWRAGVGGRGTAA
jgi:rhodanese-related sulfurtransferase